MKKGFMLFAMCLLAFSSVWSQGGHKQMLTEGRSWKIMVVTKTWEVNAIYENIKMGPYMVGEVEETFATTYTTYTVTGKTMMEGKPCYSVNRSSFVLAKVDPERYSEEVELPNPADVFYMYEEDGKVYSYTPNFSDGWQLEFDGNLQPGEAMSNNRIVDHIDAINVKGEVYRRFTFKDGSCWIEGIGSPKYGMLNDMNAETNPEITVFKMNTISVYDSDHCIFETDGFTAEGKAYTTRICSANRSTDNILASTMYDLQGRRLTADPRKGIYIRGGRKVVVK